MSIDFHEDEFNKKALELFNISKILNDTWTINEKDQKFYLSKKKIISVKCEQPLAIDDTDDDDPAVVKQTIHDDLFSIEYHVLFHPSYQIPVLYFNAYSDGVLVSLDDVTKIFKYEECHDDIKNIVTQAEHPILFKPFFMVHPCMVNKILADFPQSKNFILTFVTLFGPTIQLDMSPDYDKFYDSR